MIGLANSQNYYLYTQPCDMRKGFDGLCGVVISHMRRDPADGAVYVFINRRRDRVKMLVWETGGFMLYYKRLEQGTLEMPEHPEGQAHLRINLEVLSLMIQGILLSKIVRKKRYKRA